VRKEARDGGHENGGDHHSNGLQQHNDEEYLTVAKRGVAASTAAADHDDGGRKQTPLICLWRSFEVELLAGGGGESGEGSRYVISWPNEAVEGGAAEVAPDDGVREIAPAIQDGAGRFDGALG
jgi:hypothetical protein